MKAIKVKLTFASKNIYYVTSDVFVKNLITRPWYRKKCTLSLHQEWMVLSPKTKEKYFAIKFVLERYCKEIKNPIVADIKDDRHPFNRIKKHTE